MPAALVLWLLIILASVAGAATYYVSNSGSDSNNGTSTSTPWQTCAKVNTFVFQPGDQVLFLRGGNWYESLNPQGGSGAAGNPITFADYGSGNKPMFWGSITLANSSFTNVSGTVWQCPSATQINCAYVNGVALIVANPNANQPVSGIANSFYWSNGVLQINVSTDPNTDGNLYQGSVRSDLICNGNPNTYVLNSHYVFTNLAVNESGDPNSGYGVRIMNGTDVTLNNIESYRCGKHNFGVINSTQVVLNGCLAEYPMPNQDQFGGYSAYVSYGDSSTGLANQTSVYNNCVGDNMQDTMPSQYEDTGYEFFTTHGSNVGSVILNNCQALSSSAGGAGAHWTLNNSDSVSAGTPAILKINGGVQQNNQLYLQGTGIVVNGLTMIGPGGTSTNDATATIDMESSNTTLENMLLYNFNVGYWLYSAAIEDDGANNIIRFNTIINNANSGDATVLSHSSTETFAGNLVVNSGGEFADNPPATSEDNLFYAAASSAGFVNAAGNNYELASGSPAIHEVPLSVAYPSTDITNTARPDGSSNDAGAYQYGSTGSASTPYIYSSSTATGAVGSAFTYAITATNTPTSYAATGLPAGLSINTSTGVISGTPTTLGTTTATVTATNSSGTSPNFSLTITIQTGPPVITSASTASGTTGAAFSFTVTGSNTPTSFSASGLPAGLSINSSTGVISGTPTTAGTSSATVSATNSAGTGNATLTITIALAKPTITSSLTVGGTQNEAFSYQITATGTPTSYNATGLPTGVTVNTSTGLISGTPSVHGSYSVALSAVNSAGTGTATLALTIAAPPPAPVINSSLTSSGYTGSTYSYTITATNSPVSYNATGLPAGLSVNTSTGVISGTPASTGASSVTISATNGGGTGSATLTLTVYPPVPAITSTLAATGYLASPFTYQITASNSPTSYSASGLPAGLSINTSTGAISGTPSGTTGTSNVTIGATNAGGTGSATLVITIKAALTGQLNGTVGTPASEVNLTTEGTADWAHWGSEGSGNDDHKNVTSLIGWSAGPTPFTYGSNAISYLWTDGSSNWNGTPQATGFYFSNGSGNNAFTITAPADSTTRVLKIYAGTNSGTGYLTATLSDGSAPTYTSATLGSSANSEYTLTYKAGSAGQTLTVLWVAVSGQVTIQSADLAVSTNPAPVVTSALTATGKVGTAFAYTIVGSNSPTSYAASGLPSGLSVNTSTGVISGTPTTAGTSSVTISATNANGTGSATLALTVNPASPVITSTLTATGTVGSAFSYTIAASNSPTSYSATGLPAGLSVNTSSGVISGTPTTAATSSVTIGATNAGGTGSAALSLTINAGAPSAPVVNSTLTASGAVSTSFTYTITATNSPTSYNATGLPAGLSVNTSTGVISGTPTTAGTSSVTISATNAGGTGSATLVITVSTAGTGPNVYAIFNLGSTVTNGGADSYSNAYEASLVGKTVGYNNSSFTFGPANAPDAYTSETISLPAGNYTQLNMLATGVGGVQNSQTFIVNYTDGTSQTFTQSLSDWVNPQGFAGETKVLTMANRLSSTGAVETPTSYIYGYTFALNGKSVQSITIPNNRGVIVFGFSPGAYNVNAIFTLGTALTNGGADTYSNAYEASLIGTTATFNGSMITFGPANVPDAFSNETVGLPAGITTTLNVFATAVGGTLENQTFTVNYTDGTTQTFTQSLSDWAGDSEYSGETPVVTMANRLNSAGAVETPQVYVYGYTFTLNGKTAASITLPSTRYVVAFGFGGH